MSKKKAYTKIIQFNQPDKNAELITEDTVIDGRYAIASGWVEISDEVLEEYKELWKKLANR